MALFLGVDGGQSSTEALIGDDAGRVLGTGLGGPCNHVGAAEGREKLARAVGESVALAAKQAGFDASQMQFEAACFGMSGGPDDKQVILGEILRARKLVVTHDALIALSGATGGEPGVVTIAGTGSIAFGRNAAGETARAGGWGFLFGDEGSGFDIARQALRAALRFEEGWGPQTSLHRALLDFAGAADANELMHRLYTREWPKPRVAALAKLVETEALASDAVARDILLNAAQQLATLAVSVRRRLFQPGEATMVCYIGGVFRTGMLLERYRQLVELEDGTWCAPPRYNPAAGALLEAYRAAGLHPALSDNPELKL
ncbi:MAG TPA: BadF/BadG/BcrA/BcrD ATPase family protein [Bryobacteraceae bacterium]|nr:BadF/BadG/BcrA/BcrD ATPase family protein [Bryobacteraceae bacterium]